MKTSEGLKPQNKSRRHGRKRQLDASLAVNLESDLLLKDPQEAEEAVLRIFEGSKELSRSGEGRGDGADLYPCKNEAVRWQGRTKVSLNPCNCHSSWCPKCWPRVGVKWAVARLKRFDWRRTCQIVLTPERKYRDGQECYETIVKERGIGNFVKNLQRTGGIVITDWVKFLELHEDGYPHWHLFIEVDKEGKAGMIGQDKIHHYWKYGTWIYESPIKNLRHWNRLLGYFGKHGYFSDGKEYQGRLPEWGLDRGRRIKRWAGKASPKSRREDSPKEPARQDSLADALVKESGERKERRTYRAILSSCGSKTFLRIKSKGWKDTGMIGIPYDQLKEFFPWEYEEGVGLSKEMDETEFADFVSVLEWLVGEASIEAAGVEGKEEGAPRSESGRPLA